MVAGEEAREMTTEASFFGLAGKKAMVIGGGQGMGESTSRFLARSGCDVAVIDVERDRAERVAGVVEEVGCRGVPIVGDVLDDAQIPTIVAAAEQQFGHVDVMVSIVGAAAWGPLLDTTAEIWDQQLHLNMRYFFLCAREVAATMITEQFLTIEAKYQNAVQMPNFVHLMMASNEDWVVPAALDARRFFVLEVSAVRAKDHAYFGDIWSELDNGGYQAMLHDLLKHDLTFYNPRRVPVTEGLQTQRKLSLPAAEDW
jgi:NAD(P)-dependent dehydrogenase (short-subunit alcohol dehydrogenase family)